MSRVITFSPKHGLNLCQATCYFCGKENGESIPLGRIDEEDSEAPKGLVVDYNPCPDCAKKFSEGVIVVEVSKNPVGENQPSIVKGYYPTGRSIFVQATEKHPNGSKVLMRSAVFENIFGGEFKNPTVEVICVK